MAIKVGDAVPAVKFKVLGADGMKDIGTDELFKGKTVVLFSVPGAFTPTCHAKHVPSFKQHAGALKAKGVNTIACVSVNDAFVMKAWKDNLGVGDDILMLADGNGEFARATGLTLDGTGFGLGQRSTRYAMVVKDGKVAVLNVEASPGEMTVSSAEAILKAL